MIAAMHKISEVLESTAAMSTEIDFGKRHRSCIRSGFAGMVMEPKVVIVVVKGFLLYANEEMRGEVTLRCWLEADMEICMRCRRSRGSQKQTRRV